jgi:hypothetical protein
MMAVPPSPIHFTGDVTVENIFFPDNAKLPMGSQCLVQETAKGVSDAGKANPVPRVPFRWPAYLPLDLVGLPYPLPVLGTLILVYTRNTS